MPFCLIRGVGPRRFFRKHRAAPTIRRRGHPRDRCAQGSAVHPPEGDRGCQGWRRGHPQGLNGGCLARRCSYQHSVCHWSPQHQACDWSRQRKHGDQEFNGTQCAHGRICVDVAIGQRLRKHMWPLCMCAHRSCIYQQAGLCRNVCVLGRCAYGLCRREAPRWEGEEHPG